MSIVNYELNFNAIGVYYTDERLMSDRAMAVAVSRRPLTAAARVRFMVDKVTVGQVSFGVLRVSLLSIILPTLRTHRQLYTTHKTSPL